MPTNEPKPARYCVYISIYDNEKKEQVVEVGCNYSHKQDVISELERSCKFMQDRLS